MAVFTPRVRVPNKYTPAQNLNLDYYHPKPKYLTIGYMEPLGYRDWMYGLGGRGRFKLKVLGFTARVQLLLSAGVRGVRGLRKKTARRFTSGSA